jgi:hypothetical protein
MNRNAMLLLAALAAGGCGLVEDPTPDEARLIVEGEAGKQVRLIISTKFVASVNQANQTQVVLFAADTVVTTLPYEAVYLINEDQRYFAEASWLETDLQNLHMEVAIDREVRFAEGGALRAGLPYRFVYAFNQPITREVVVL